MIKKILVFVFLVLLSVGTQATTLSVATDNIVAINPNTAVTVTANLSKAVWLINTGTSQAYINVWGNAATSSSRKLLPNRVYEIRMDYDQFSILGTATENIVIIQKKSTDGRDLIGGAYMDRLTYGAVTDNAIVRFDGTSGSFIQGSNANIDDNGNLSTNRVFSNALSITSSGGTTTLTSASPQNIILTGSSTQTIVLPDATTMAVNDEFFIVCTSTSASNSNILANGGGVVHALNNYCFVRLKLTDNSTAAGTWSNVFFGASANAPSSVVTRTNAGAVLSTSMSATTFFSGPSFRSSSASGSVTGVLRASASDIVIGVRNAANNADLTLTKDANDVMTWNAPLAATQMRPSSNREALSGNKTITATAPQYQFLDPNGSNRDVTLPVAVSGMLFIVKNIGTGGYTLTVKDSGGSAITGGVIANSVVMGFMYDGTAWQLI
jgi:hypothetical protein